MDSKKELKKERNDFIDKVLRDLTLQEIECLSGNLDFFESIRALFVEIKSSANVDPASETGPHRDLNHQG